jgi:hypothetical protein
MNFFIESCKANPSVDWIFYTDCGEPENRAPNLRYRAMSFGEYCALASDRIGLPFRPDGPYKLVDLKPAWGQIHADDIRGYDFYGYCDIDVIFGDIRRFYGDELLGRYQLLSTHPERVSGHLALFENSELMLQAFRRIADWEERVSAGGYRAVAENRFTKVFLPRKRHPGWLRRVYGVLSPYWRRNYFHEQFSTVLSPRLWHDGSRDHPEVWFWKGGRLTNERDGDREFLYLHFMNWKSGRWLKHDGPAAWTTQESIIHLDWREAARHGFKITRRGFEPLEDLRRGRNGTLAPQPLLR